MPQVKDLGLCTVLMMDDSTYPVWLVLVPRQVSPLLATRDLSQLEHWLLTTADAPRQGSQRSLICQKKISGGCGRKWRTAVTSCAGNLSATS